MNLKPIDTNYGIISTRDALILDGCILDFYPWKVTIQTKLLLSGCITETPIKDKKEISLNFLFFDIENINIYRLDDYPNEKYSKSSFDLVLNYQNKKKERVILSTYDHVFDITGCYQIIEAD